MNTGLSYDDGRANAIKSLMIGTCIETVLQLYSFIANPALRLPKSLIFVKNNIILSFFKKNSLIIVRNCLFRLFSWKRIMKLFNGIRCNIPGVRIGSKNKIVPVKKVERSRRNNQFA